MAWTVINTNYTFILGLKPEVQTPEKMMRQSSKHRWSECITTLSSEQQV